ncbi:MAG: SDR family oxidoreductase [Actinobacteria bacterium]|nr:SDR family oxidoreductase [Actinomycetota bacterium]
MDSHVRGKVVVITGASSGLGEALARQLAERGARLVLAARRGDRLTQLTEEIVAQGGEAIGQQTDVSDKTQVAALIAQALTTFGQVDVLVNNAGIMPASSFAKNDTDEWDRLIDINIKGVLYGIGAVLPHMRERKSGHIVNVSSTAAHHTTGLVAPVYSATKHAVKEISDGLRAEEALVGSGIRITEMAPGMIDTDLKHTVTDPEMNAMVMQAYAPGQAMLTADAMARPIVYAIDQPDNVTIASIIVKPTGT